MTGILIFFIAVTALVLPAAPAFAEDLKMQIEGQTWAATVINSTLVPMGGQKVISISGKREGDKTSMLSFQLAPASPDAPLGHYDLKSGLPKGSVANGGFNTDLLGGDPMEDSFRFQSGSLDVTAYDPATHGLSGTFSGTLKNHSGSRSINIQNGALDGVTISGN